MLTIEAHVLLLNIESTNKDPERVKQVVYSITGWHHHEWMVGQERRTGCLKSMSKKNNLYAYSMVFETTTTMAIIIVFPPTLLSYDIVESNTLCSVYRDGRKDGVFWVTRCSDTTRVIQ